MRIYLTRHCDAVHPLADGTRPLSERGLDQARRLAAWMPRAIGAVHEVRHSGVLRAEQTAAILAEAARPEAGVRAVAGLTPGDSAEAAVESLRWETQPLLVVTHLPIVARIAALLLGTSAHSQPLAFHTGTIAAFDGSGMSWSLDWLVNPELLPSL